MSLGISRKLTKVNISGRKFSFKCKSESPVEKNNIFHVFEYDRFDLLMNIYNDICVLSVLYLYTANDYANKK